MQISEIYRFSYVVYEKSARFIGRAEVVKPLGFPYKKIGKSNFKNIIPKL